MIGMISCKEASYLTSKKEEGKISLAERLKLAFHLMMCRFCKMFDKQNTFIAHHAKQMEDALADGNEVLLPETVKQRINDSMN